MLSNVPQTLRRSPLPYGVMFAVLPVLLGLAIGPMVGFGPCGPNVPGSVRLLVIAAGILAIGSPYIAAWLFRISFRSRKGLTALVALPLLSVSLFVSLYWLFVLFSAVMT